MTVRIINSDCLTALPQLAAEGVRAHCVVTDPPAGIGFMGREWDSDKGGRDHWIAWMQQVAAETLRCVRPGAHALVWALPRTSHWTATAWENAGWVVRDRVAHLFGSGFPKSLDVSKAIDKAAGENRGRKLDFRNGPNTNQNTKGRAFAEGACGFRNDATAEVDNGPATPEAAAWSGWGTALKPAVEDWWLFRAPMAGTVAANVLAHGTGALNIDAARVLTEREKHHTAPTSPGDVRSSRGGNTVCTCSEHGASSKARTGGMNNQASASSELGGHVFRPASAPPRDRLDLEPQGSQAGYPTYRRSGDAHAHAGTAADQSSPPQQSDEGRSPDRCAKCGRIRADHSRPCATIPNIQPAGRWPSNLVHDGSPEVEEAFAAFGEKSSGSRSGEYSNGTFSSGTVTRELNGDTGSASRFFYTAKADATDRAGSRHPTIKPTSLMRWLVQLVCPPGGLVLDPFAGSGSTGLAADQLGFDAILIERDPTYAADARRKIMADAPLFAEVAD